jgi:antitoxin component YwqK of YwqJK toxin-antitoxin module
LIEKEELIKTLSEKAKAYDEMMESKKKQVIDELNSLQDKLTPEQLEEHSMFLEDLSDEKKIIYLKRITEQKPESFDNKVDDGEKISAKTEYEKAKERGDVRAMLKYAPKI